LRNDVVLNGWVAECESAERDDDFYESVFFTGNGRIGIRGYLPVGLTGRPLKAGLYIAGIFEEIKNGLTDIVHLPTPVCETAFSCGAEMKILGGATRRLNLKTGVLSVEYTLSSENARLRVTHERFAALDNTGCIVQRTRVKAESPSSFEWHTGISLASRNNPVPDDQVKTNEEILRLFEESTPEFLDGCVSVGLKTPKTGLCLSYDCAIKVKERDERLYIPGEFAGFRRHFTLRAEDEATVEKLCFIATSRDHDPNIISRSSWSYDDCLRSHEAEWEARWLAVSLPPLEDGEMETALRYTAAQLIMNGAAHDETVSIGARGLTHPRYKGCYFWDTDLFMQPFYEQTHPQTARNLARYRINCLPAAKKHALETSAKGARYPWMASLYGNEQCESWDIGFAEVHITADIVYSIDRYIAQTGDGAVYPEAAEVYVETARFWADRCTRSADGTVNLLFVKGPDEYCGITNNNLFTNMMVKRNLCLAIEAAAFIKERMPEKYAALGIAKAETDAWKTLADELPIARNPMTGHLQQDDTFHLLEPVSPASLKDGSGASYHKVSFDRVQRYKVIKQADLLLLMTRMPEEFTKEEKRLAWQDYEPLCLHDSTLSFATHALFAAQNGLGEDAEKYLRKALFLDLRDVMGNTGKEGLHLANFGECWQAAVRFYGS
jgi:kojibiose phosphorylase